MNWKNYAKLNKKQRAEYDFKFRDKQQQIPITTAILFMIIGTLFLFTAYINFELGQDSIYYFNMLKMFYGVMRVFTWVIVADLIYYLVYNVQLIVRESLFSKKCFGRYLK